METENIAEFIPLLNHDDYEILSTFPFTIRRKDNHYEVKESVYHTGYKLKSIMTKDILELC